MPKQNSRESKSYEGPKKYQQLDWAKNCVLQALSKTLHKSVHTITRELVDGGPLDKISLLENGSAVKKALDHYKYVPLVEGGATWKNLRHRLNGKDGQYYAIWWGNNGTQEEWTDRGGTCHAFTIYVIGSNAELPATNMPDFDKHHPTSEEWVSAWRSPESKTLSLRPVLEAGGRRINLG